MDAKLCYINNRIMWEKIDKEIYDQMRYIIDIIFDEIFLIDIICDLYYKRPYVNISTNNKYLSFEPYELTSLYNKDVNDDIILTHQAFNNNNYLLDIYKKKTVLKYGCDVSTISFKKINCTRQPVLYKPKSKEIQKMIQYIYDNCNSVINIPRTHIMSHDL